MTARVGRGSSFVVVVLLAALLSGCARATAPPPPANAAYRNPALAPADRARDLLTYMTLDEKLGQMTVGDRANSVGGDARNLGLGAVINLVSNLPSPNTPTSWADDLDAVQQQALGTRLAIPLLTGLDAVHGQAHVVGSTVFPHNIGLGATRDPALVEQIGRVTAIETAATGINWNFAPTISVARNARWGRTYESFGEIPELPTSMTSYVTGLQGADVGTGRPSVMATVKSYLGDGGTTGGIDKGDTTISEAQLRAIHLPPFQAAVTRGAGSVMVGYSSWNGVKNHANRYLITDLLKDELGFDGIVVSDFMGIEALHEWQFPSAADVATGINAGIDLVMPMIPLLFISYARQGVQNGAIPMARIDDAVTRILTKKFELGLFERPLTDRTLQSAVGSSAHRELARRAVRESQVLLKNDQSVLPLAKSAKVFVAGKSAHDIGNQSGGWTIGWQGQSGAITQGTTILDAIRQSVANPSQVTYDREGDGINGTYNAAIAVVGETPYAEGSGDRYWSMKLDAEDLATIAKLRATGVPVIVVLVSGRPLNITAELPKWAALVAAWLPGTEGRGVTDVLFGDAKPTGKLPISWFSDEAQEPVNVGDGKTPLFPFGFGLTYP